MPDRLILCSGSPRRKELLEGAGFAFEIDVADIDEKPVLEGKHRSREARAHRAAQSVADLKAAAVAKRRRERLGAEETRDEVYLAADTIVVLGDAILGKPADDRDAK